MSLGATGKNTARGRVATPRSSQSGPIRHCLGCDSLFDAEDDAQEFCSVECHEATLYWRDKLIVCEYCEEREASEVDHIELGRYSRVAICYRCLGLLSDQWLYSFHARKAFVRDAIAKLQADHT
jgi:hypothetical protein